jgi:putative PEP-CTERM system TPR-repeat lipoprotein
MQTFKVRKIVQVLGYSLFLTLAACSDDLSQEQENLIQVQAYLGLAEVYMNQGQFRASVIETQNAFDLMPRNADVLSFIGRLYLEIGDLNQATRQIDTAVEISPDSAELKLLKVETLLASNKLNEGMALLNATSVPPELGAQKAFLLGSLHASAGNNEAAETAFTEALALDNAHAPALIGLARLAYLSGNSADVSTFTDRAASAAGDDPDVWIWKGQLALLQEDYAASEAAFKEALDIMAAYDIMTVKKYTTLQSILIPLRALQKNDEALVYSGILANTPQGQFTTAFNNALSLFQQGAPDQAEVALSSLLETAPDHPASNILLGLTKYTEGNFSEAERLLSQYVQADTASPQLLAALAQTHLQMNRPEQALAVLRQAAEASPDNASILAMIGTIQRGTGDLSGALATMNSALAIDPDSTDILLGIAGTYVLMGDDANAVSSLEKAIAIDPAANQPKSALLSLLSSREDLNAAKQQIDSWLAEDPDSADNNIFAGFLALRQEDTSAARRYFENVLATDPTHLSAQLYLARVDVAEQEYSDAQARFNAILAEHPDNPDAVGGILALGNVTGSEAASIQNIEQVIAANPTEFVPLLVLGQYYLLANDLPKAVETAEKAFAIGQNTFTQALLIDALTRSARETMQAGNTSSGSPFLARVLEIQNNNVEAHFLLANIATAEGNYLRAMDEVTLIRNLQPDNAISHELEGDVLQTQGKNAEALAAYQAGWAKQKTASLGLKTFQLMKTQNQIDQGIRFLQDWAAEVPTELTPPLLLGMEYQATNRNGDAIESYENAYKLDQSNLVVLNNLAWLYQDTVPARALELSARAASLFPQNPDVLDTYGWILYKQGNTATALTQLENAARLAPDVTSIQEHLSVVRSEQQ